MWEIIHEHWHRRAGNSQSVTVFCEFLLWITNTKIQSNLCIVHSERFVIYHFFVRIVIRVDSRIVYCHHKKLLFPTCFGYEILILKSMIWHTVNCFVNKHTNSIFWQTEYANSEEEKEVHALIEAMPRILVWKLSQRVHGTMTALTQHWKTWIPTHIE